MVFPLLQIFLGRENWKWKEIRFAEMRMRMRMRWRMKSKERWAANRWCALSREAREE
jgi:hypothetical protein